MDTLLFLNGLMLTRLVFLFRDQALSLRALVALGVVQLLWITGLFGPGLGWALLAVLAALGLVVSERLVTDGWRNEARLGSLVVVVIAVIAWPPSAHGWVTAVIAAMEDGLWQAGAGIDAATGLWSLFGALLLANEVNLLIRSLFHRTGLEPRMAGVQTGDALDQREYNAGRIIGILERWLIYSVLIASDNYGVIAIIIAAKGFARFRQLEERVFAEYVLIGTLASTLVTLVVTQLIRLPLSP